VETLKFSFETWTGSIPDLICVFANNWQLNEMAECDELAKCMGEMRTFVLGGVKHQ